MSWMRGLRTVLTCGLLAGVASVCAGQQTPVNHSSNVRKTASQRSAIVGTLNVGDSVALVSGTPTGRYVEVKTSDGTDGWVLATNVGIKVATGGFKQSCDAPAFPGAATVIDATSCPAEGSPDKNGGTDEAAQNESKNNFCPKDDVKPVTIDEMVALQQSVPKSVPFGSTYNSHPLRKTPGPAIARGPLEALGERDTVVLTGYLSFVNQEGGETVNCNSGKKKSKALNPYADIHMNLVSQAGDEQCNGIVAEMIPHHRPDAWNYDNVTSVFNAGLMVRVTGNRMFDSSHSPCIKGSALKGDPQRASLWEVHPIYKFEVCTSGTCSSGSGWVDLEAWKP